MKNIIISLLFLVPAFAANAQFIPYSQYQVNPVLTNPAQAAMSDQTQVIFQYRQSRVSDYEIPAVSLLYPLFLRNGNKNRYGGIAATIIRQSSGPENMFSTTGFIAGFSYNLHLSSEHHISAGLQGGLVNKKIDVSRITTESQYNLGMYDPSLSHGEDLNSASVTRPVINAGVIWYYTDRLGRQPMSLGVALYNMNRPSYEILTGGNDEIVACIISGEAKVWQKEKLSLHPSFRYIASRASLANIGGYGAYAFSDQQQVSVGLWYKTSNAMVFNIRYDHASYLVAVASEFSVATHLEAGINNAFEIALGWKMNNIKRGYNPMH